MVNATSEYAFMDLPIPDFELEVHVGGMPGAPGGIVDLEDISN